MSQRIFKIREHLLKGSKKAALEDPFNALGEGSSPVSDIVWMRYHLTLKAMDKRFKRKEDMFDYILELEDFIYSAVPPDIEFMP